MLGTCSYTFLEVALLHTLDKSRSHRSRQISVLTIGFLKTIETGNTAHIDHWREGKNSTHFSHGCTSLTGLEFGQLRVERASLSYLLRIDCCTHGVNARQGFLMA